MTTGAYGLFCNRARESGFRQARIGDRLRPVEMCLQKRDLRVEHIGAHGDTRPESLADDASSLRGAADGVVGSFDRRPARIELARALTQLHSKSRVEVGETLFSRARGRGSLGNFGTDAAAIEQRPIEVDAACRAWP